MTEVGFGRLIGKGARAEVYERDGRALKLYAPGVPRMYAFREAANLALIGATGLPVPEVFEVGQYGGRWGLETGLAAGETLFAAAGNDPARLVASLPDMVALQRQVHAQSVPQLPALKARLALKISEAPKLSEAKRAGLLQALAAMPEGDRLCHGDFHPLNLIGPPDNLTIIDWLDATSGDPAADVCRSYVIIHPELPELAQIYLASYCKAADMAETDVRRWLPFVAAARLTEEVGRPEALLSLLGE